MADDFNRKSLTKYERIYKKYHFTCVYCGFDGRSFDAWMQLSIDHVLPKSSGTVIDDEYNLVVACRSCNSITGRMEFNSGKTFNQIIKEKREKVINSRKKYYKEWQQFVAPKYLDRPLPILHINE
jgi:hypothetical protein